jgi:hypothetical protein
MRYARLLSVTVPASDRTLVSLATVKDELVITDSRLDSRLTRWIGEISAMIEHVVGRTLRAETVSETLRSTACIGATHGEHDYPRMNRYDDTAATGLRLTRYPIQTITSVTEDDIVLTAGVDYETDAQAGLLYRLSGTVRIPWYGQVLVVVYTGGYPALTDVPADLQGACLVLLQTRKSSQMRDPALRQINIPGVLEQQFQVTVGPTGGLPLEVDAVLQRYRDVRL